MSISGSSLHQMMRGRKKWMVVDCAAQSEQDFVRALCPNGRWSILNYGWNDKRQLWVPFQPPECVVATRRLLRSGPFTVGLASKRAADHGPEYAPTCRQAGSELAVVVDSGNMCQRRPN